MKPKIVKSYCTTKERDWGSCQENDNSDSAYTNVDVVCWQIYLGKKLIADQIHSEYLAKQFVNSWFNKESIEKRARDLLKAQKSRFEELETEYIKCLKKWKKAQVARRKLLSEAKPIPNELMDLSGLLLIQEDESCPTAQASGRPSE